MDKGIVLNDRAFYRHVFTAQLTTYNSGRSVSHTNRRLP